MRRSSLPWRATLTFVVLALLLTSVFLVIAQGEGGSAQVETTEEADEAESLRVVPGGSIYIARLGDTFWTIGERYNISIVSLLQANPEIHPNRILIGDEILLPNGAPPFNAFPELSYPFLLTPLPGATPYQMPPVRPGDRVYIMQPRDVLDLLGALLDVQVMCIIEYNNITNPVYIYAGQPIVIPGDCPSYDGLSTAVPPWAPDLEAGFGTFQPTARPQSGGNQQPGTGQQPVEATPTFTPIVLPSATPTIAATPIPVTPTQAATTPAVPATRPPTVTPTPPVAITATATG